MEKDNSAKNYYVESFYRLHKKLFSPFIFVFLGILVFIFLENTSVRGLPYLLLFLFGVVFTLFWIVKACIIIIRLMRKDWKDYKVDERERKYMSDKSNAISVYVYTVLAIVCFFVFEFFEISSYVNFLILIFLLVI